MYAIHNCFFSHCTSPNRDLHSFPTRRSSDLGAPQPVPRRAHRRRPPRHDRRPPRGPDRLPRLLLPRSPQDRKSTRLNSSHVEISYAVFCLKKKKNNQTVPTLLTTERTKSVIC